MKLRFRNNSVRLRVNRREVEALVEGRVLEEQISFPRNSRIAYTLQSSSNPAGEASFEAGTIRISAPAYQVNNWASTDTVGIYFELPANGSSLKVAIEKDLECVDGSPEEYDPEAFPRAESSKTC